MYPTMREGWFLPFGGLLFILLSELLILALVFVARMPRTGDGLEGASVTLDRRLASGEASKEQHARLQEVRRR